MKFNKITNTEKVPDYNDCWAKTNSEGMPALSVWQHAIHVGASAEAIIERLPGHLSTSVPTGFVTLAAVHDVGKIAPCFQTKCNFWAEQYGISKPITDCPHAMISEETLTLYGIPTAYAEIIGFHHGWRTRPEDIGNAAGGKSWREKREKYLEDMEALLRPLPRESANFSLSYKYFLCGLVVLADWIGSSEEFFPLENKCRLDFESAKNKARDGLDKLKLFTSQPTEECLFDEMFGFSPNLLQKEFLEFYRQHASKEGGLFVLQAPMGVGKTEAGLAALAHSLKEHHSRGLFFGLPTVLTSNQIHSRVEKFLDKQKLESQKVQRLHSKAFIYTPQMQQEASPSDAIYWFGHSTKKAFLTPFGVGTIDQSLLGVLPVKHFFLRLFALAGKTIILDEVHSYDAYTGTLLKHIIHFLLELKCCIIIMSATLTSHWMRKIIELSAVSSSYPCVHFFSPKKDMVHAHPLPAPPSKVVSMDLRNIEDGNKMNCMIQEVLDRAHFEHQNILWVCNTVAEAQLIFKKLKSENASDGPEIGLLHSRFLPRDRQSIEEKWLRQLGKDHKHRPKGSILVGTQVVEQSIDIDADYLITELAPLDFLMQRTGRLWRHSRNFRPVQNPQMTITTKGDPTQLLQCETKASVKEVFGSSYFVYCPYILLRTFEVIKDLKKFDLPGDIQSLIEQVYSERQENNLIWNELYQKKIEHEKKLEGKALTRTQISLLPCLGDKEEEDLVAETRHQEYDTIPLLIVHSLNENHLILDDISIPIKARATSAFIQHIQGRQILVPAYKFKDIPKEYKVSLYGKTYILIQTGGNEAWKTEIPEVKVTLMYSPICGLQIETMEEEDNEFG